MKLPITITGLIFACACASPYFGYSKQEWNNFTTEQQDSIKSEYQDILDSRESEKYRSQINASKRNIIYRGVCGGEIGKRACGPSYRP